MPAHAEPAFPVHSITPRIDVPCGELLTVERIGGPDSARDPHRHDFAQLVRIEAGSGHHVIDFARVPIAPGQIHVLAPGQVHSWDAAGLRGTGLMFSDGLLDDLGPLPDPVRELVLLGAAPLDLDTGHVERIDRLLTAVAETRSAESGRHLVAAILWECAEGRPAQPTGSARSTLTRAFLRIALRAPRADVTVAACAAELGVTGGHLTESVVADTGSTPGRILRTAVAREAQRLLSGTTASAAQISARLGFSEPSYFSRFFRREVGRTPTDYRAVPAPADRSVSSGR